MAEEKDILEQLIEEHIIIDRRAKTDFASKIINDLEEKTSTGNVLPAEGATISIIKGEGQLLDSPDPVALVITLKADLNFPAYVVVPADPYNLLNLAHKILEKLDPSKA